MVFARKPLLLYFAILIFLQLTLCIAGWRFVRAGLVDFRNFYAIGYLIRTGQSGSLYDYPAQAAVQNQLVSPRTAALPVMIPPLAGLPFAPLSRLDYLDAFCVFAAINLLLATLSATWIARFLGALSSYASLTPALLFLSFPPLGFALLQGQLSIVLLAICCAVFVALKREKHLLAGLLLSLGLIKFQIAVPIALLFLLWRCWRFVAGFLLGASVFIAASLAIVGTAHASDMFRAPFSAAARSNSIAQLQYGVYFDRMPNLYGLMYAVSHSAKWAIIPTLLVSICLLAWAARKRPSLEFAVPVALLVSYHLYLHDLTLLLLPFAHVLDRYLASDSATGSDALFRNKTVSGTASLLIFPLLAICLVPSNWISLLCIPMVFVALALGRPSAAPAHSPAEALA